MAASYTNWANSCNSFSETARKQVEKLEKREKKRIKDGWKWFKLSANTKIFIPCDGEGNPTEEGERMIESARKSYY